MSLKIINIEWYKISFSIDFIPNLYQFLIIKDKKMWYIIFHPKDIFKKKINKYTYKNYYQNYYHQINLKNNKKKSN